VKYFFINCVKGGKLSEVIDKKTQLENLCKLSAMLFAPYHRAVVFAKEFIYSPSKGDVTREKALRS